VDAELLEQKVSCSRTAVQEMQMWLARRGIETETGPVRAYLRKYELWERGLQLRLTPAGRREFLAYMREERKLYWSYWSAGTKAYKLAYAAAGLIFGVRALAAIRQLRRRRFP
jgi:hypothetical protein